MLFRIVILAAILLAVGLALAPGRAAGAPLPDCVTHSRWIEARTRHFDLLTNTSEAEAREQARRLEWLAQTIERWGPALRDRSGRRVMAYGLAGDGCFAPFRTRFEGRVAEMGGYAMSSALGRYLAYAAGGGAYSGNAPHEMAHAVLAGSLLGLPACLDEGLAEYFSTFQASERAIEYGHPIPGRQACLRANAPMSLDELFAITSGSRDYHVGRRRDLFYAESWALVRYLMTRPGDAHDRFDHFLELLQRGRPARVAFTACFPGENWDRVPAALARLASAPDEHVELDPGRDVEPVTVEIATPSQRDVCARLGELMAYAEGPGEHAEQPFLDAALAPDGRHARALATLGWLAEKGGHGPAAERYYTRSLDLDSADARTWFIAGQGEISRWWKERHSVLQGMLPPELAEARRRLEHCLRLAPGDMEALALWGRTYVFDLQPPAGALQALERASDALHDRLDVLVDRIQVLLNAERAADARVLYDERVAPRADPDLRRRIEARLGAAPARRDGPGSATRKGPSIVSRAPAGRPDEVVVPGTGSAPLTFEHAEFRRAIDRAFALIRESKVREARAVFVDLARRPLDERARDYVRDCIRRMDEALRERR